MKQHVNKVAAACYCQLRRLRQIRRPVGPEVTTQLVLALVTCRLDYCNSVLASLPQSTVEPLQRVQNAASRMIFNLGRHDKGGSVRSLFIDFRKSFDLVDHNILITKLKSFSIPGTKLPFTVVWIIFVVSPTACQS